MKLYLLDTDTLSLYQSGHPAVVQRVQGCPAEGLDVSIITVEEQLTGWYAKVRKAKQRDQLARAYERLTLTVRFLSKLRILSFPESTIIRYEALRAARRRLGKNDLRIAAIALDASAILVTGNTRDFEQIPSLEMEDWSR